MTSIRYQAVLALSVLAGCAAQPTDAVSEVQGALSPSPNDEAAFNFFVGKGLTDIQAAGIVGNLDQESQMNPGSIQSDGPGRGIAQWSTGGRWDTSKNDNVVAFASAHGESATSLGLQLDFIWYELTTFGYGLASLRAATNVSDATIRFETDYEICGNCQEATRISYANKALQTYGGHAPPPQATQMQLVALTNVGLYHTVRASSGAWSGFGNVLGQTGALAGITQIAEAGVGGDMQLVALTNDTIYHAVRTAAGAWTGWGNVEGQVGSLTGITGLAAAGVSGQLQVVAVANDTVYHAIRNSAGTWTAWGNVEGAVGALSHVTALAAAELNGELNLLAVASDTLYHAIRHANGTWTAWGSVEGQTGSLTGITAVAAAGVSGQLQVVVATGTTLNHTVRNSAGAWTGWGNVEGQTGPIPAVTSLSAASVSGQLQVIAIAGGTIYHALRTAAGAWTGWGNVSSAVSGESGTPLRVAATGT
jgi:hypothetical protein